MTKCMNMHDRQTHPLMTRDKQDPPAASGGDARDCAAFPFQEGTETVALFYMHTFAAPENIGGYRAFGPLPSLAAILY